MILDLRTMGERIRALRKHRKLTQEQLAERIARSPAFVGHIERGTRRMSLETLREMAMALECSTDELLGLVPRGVDRRAGARELLALAQGLAREEK